MYIHCAECLRTPSEIPDEVALADAFGMTPDEYIMRIEGTYNSENGLYLCTDCYMAVDMPALPWPQQWKVPDDYKPQLKK